MDIQLLERLNSLPRDQKEELYKVLEEHYSRGRYNQLDQYFTTDGSPFDYKLWEKHWEFMQKGSLYMLRCISGANRSGKTNTAGTEWAYHLTGLYPDGSNNHPRWEGRIFYDPIELWVVGSDPDSLRNGIQKTLIGDFEDPGTGLIPKHLIKGDPKQKPGAPEMALSIRVKHIAGHYNKCYFKTSKQGVDAFRSASVDGILMDELQPWEIFSECVTRLANKKGIFILAASPEKGMSPVTMKFIPHGKPPNPPRFCGQVGPTDNSTWTTVVGWKDVPETALNGGARKALLATYLPHEIRAKTEGLPSFGAGLIFPFDEQDITFNPLIESLPLEWPRAFAFDPGGTAAAVWGAWDENHKRWYIYDEYKTSGRNPFEHVYAIKQRGDWISGVCDPSIEKQKNPETQQILLNSYRKLGLSVRLANNKVEAGIRELYVGFNTGMVKISTRCTMLLDELRTYSYGDDYKPKRDQDDHIIDALRYLKMSGRSVMKVYTDDPYEESEQDRIMEISRNTSRDSVTGY